MAATEQVYTGTHESALEVLREYDVTYVYVGPAECERYGDASVAFRAWPELSVAFENEVVTVYRVNAGRPDTAVE